MRTMPRVIVKGVTAASVCLVSLVHALPACFSVLFLLHNRQKTPVLQTCDMMSGYCPRCVQKAGAVRECGYLGAYGVRGHTACPTCAA